MPPAITDLDMRQCISLVSDIQVQVQQDPDVQRWFETLEYGFQGM